MFGNNKPPSYELPPDKWSNYRDINILEGRVENLKDEFLKLRASVIEKFMPSFQMERYTDPADFEFEVKLDGRLIAGFNSEQEAITYLQLVKSNWIEEHFGKGAA